MRFAVDSRQAGRSGPLKYFAVGIEIFPASPGMASHDDHQRASAQREETASGRAAHEIADASRIDQLREGRCA